MALLYEDAMFLYKLSLEMEWRKNPQKTVLFLGNPGSNLTYSGFYTLCKKLDIEPPVEVEKKRDNISQKIEAQDFFTLLGFSNCKSMDFSDYQQADYLYDLNNSNLPERLFNIADLIYDTGTLEHCFNTPVVLENIHHMLKKEGVIIHATPTNGYIDHGFYQISPTLYHDYYRSNSYHILGAAIFPEVHLKKSKFYFKSYQYDYDAYWNNDPQNYNKISEKYRRAIICFAAQKQSDSTFNKKIIQSWYKRINKLETFPYKTLVTFDYEIKKSLPIPSIRLPKRFHKFKALVKCVEANINLYWK